MCLTTCINRRALPGSGTRPKIVIVVALLGLVCMFIVNRLWDWDMECGETYFVLTTCTPF